MGKLKFDVTIPEIAQYDYRRNPDGGLVFPCIQSLLDFLGKFDISDCFFRGQNALWDIVSSLHRHHESAEKFKKACNISISALEWLKNNKYIMSAVQNNDDYCMAIAQHYDCPTDLVDITTDCRTAAYFATTETIDDDKPEGCIWVFPRTELERLKKLTAESQDFYFWSLRKRLADEGKIDTLAMKNYNPLMEMNIPQLSRLNAQGGAFIWDYCGILKYQLLWGQIGTRLVFKHTENERAMFSEDEGRLFPFPNQLESEIMRVFRERKPRIGGLPDYYGAIGSAAREKAGELKRGLMPEIVDNAKSSVYFPLPNFFSPSFGEYAWAQRTVSQNSYDVKNIDMTNYLECHLPFSIEGALCLVQHIIKSVKDNSLTDLLILFYKSNAIYSIPDGEEKIIIDLVITLNNYLYTDVEISKVLLEWLKMVMFKMDNNYEVKSEDEHDYLHLFGYVNDWVKKYYGCPVTKLNLGDGAAMARFWLPENYSFLDDECKIEFSVFDKSCYEPHKMIRDYCDNLPDNAKIFLYQHKPQKIMSYETMKRLFVELILPQHFAFRRFVGRVYIPDYIDKICLPIFGRELFGIDGDISMDEEKYGGFVMV